MSTQTARHIVRVAFGTLLCALTAIRIAVAACPIPAAGLPKDAGVEAEKAGSTDVYAISIDHAVAPTGWGRMSRSNHNFRHVITEFVEHYHRERNHQGLDNRLIAGAPVTDRTGRVRCRRRLGGLLNFYERAA